MNTDPDPDLAPAHRSGTESAKMMPIRADPSPQHCKKVPRHLETNSGQYIWIFRKKYNLALYLVEMNTDPDPDLAPDRWALDANPEPDPPKWCRSDRIRVHNTVRKYRYRDTWKLIILWSRCTKRTVIVVPVMRSRGVRDSPGRGWPAWPGDQCRRHASWDPPPLPAQQVRTRDWAMFSSADLSLVAGENEEESTCHRAASGLILQNQQAWHCYEIGIRIRIWIRTVVVYE